MFFKLFPKFSNYTTYLLILNLLGALHLLVDLNYISKEVEWKLFPRRCQAYGIHLDIPRSDKAQMFQVDKVVMLH